MARTVHGAVEVVEVAGILVGHDMMGCGMMRTCRLVASPYNVQPRALILPSSHTAWTISQHPSKICQTTHIGSYQIPITDPPAPINLR